jgi:hypothetical protein
VAKEGGQGGAGSDGARMSGPISPQETVLEIPCDGDDGSGQMTRTRSSRWGVSEGAVNGRG